MLTFWIEAMVAEDIDAVYGIAASALAGSCTPESLEEELHRPWARVRVLRLAPDQPAVAFLNYWWVVDEIHILNLATHPDARRMGCARSLMNEVIEFARGHLVRTITLEVRTSNVAATRLYESLGFEGIGVRANYYRDNGEDALVMVRSL